MKLTFISVISAVVLISAPLQAAEIWDCEYSNYQQTGKLKGRFHVEGDRLIEQTDDVVNGYQLLQDTVAAIVGAKGGGYGANPRVMGSLLMIKKATGEFLLITDSIGPAHGRQTGQCHRASVPPKN